MGLCSSTDSILTGPEDLEPTSQLIGLPCKQADVATPAKKRDSKPPFSKRRFCGAAAAPPAAAVKPIMAPVSVAARRGVSLPGLAVAERVVPPAPQAAAGVKRRPAATRTWRQRQDAHRAKRKQAFLLEAHRLEEEAAAERDDFVVTIPVTSVGSDSDDSESTADADAERPLPDRAAAYRVGKEDTFPYFGQGPGPKSLAVPMQGLPMPALPPRAGAEPTDQVVVQYPPASPMSTSSSSSSDGIPIARTAKTTLRKTPPPPPPANFPLNPPQEAGSGEPSFRRFSPAVPPPKSLRLPRAAAAPAGAPPQPQQQLQAQRVSILERRCGRAGIPFGVGPGAPPLPLPECGGGGGSPPERKRSELTPNGGGSIRALLRRKCHDNVAILAGVTQQQQQRPGAACSSRAAGAGPPAGGEEACDLSFGDFSQSTAASGSGNPGLAVGGAGGRAAPPSLDLLRAARKGSTGSRENYIAVSKHASSVSHGLTDSPRSSASDAV
ncbi:hypothetical protein DIPPA_32895 [Diplonema papillatum]|nr:hypothetical protein DIPPA_32895 [Diplonema papillatum]